MRFATLSIACCPLIVIAIVAAAAANAADQQYHDAELFMIRSGVKDGRKMARVLKAMPRGDARAQRTTTTLNDIADDVQDRVDFVLQQGKHRPPPPSSSSSNNQHGGQHRR